MAKVGKVAVKSQDHRQPGNQPSALGLPHKADVPPHVPLDRAVKVVERHRLSNGSNTLSLLVGKLTTNGGGVLDGYVAARRPRRALTRCAVAPCGGGPRLPSLTAWPCGPR